MCVGGGGGGEGFLNPPPPSTPPDETLINITFKKANNIINYKFTIIIIMVYKTAKVAKSSRIFFPVIPRSSFFETLKMKAYLLEVGQSLCVHLLGK